MIKTLILFTLVTLTAQTTTFGPTAVDFRYAITWTDPNPPGQVASWMVYATNSMSSRSVGSSGTTAPVVALLNGAPAGTYTCYTTAISPTGAEGDPGDKLLVVWPGGNGKPHGGNNLSAFK